MADPSHSLTCNVSDPQPQDRKEGEVIEKSKLRPRRQFKEIPPMEQVDPKYKELILKLPAEKRWGTMSLRQFHGSWVGEQILPGYLMMQEAFEPRPSDVFITSFPKSGTTWLKALTFTVMHRDKYNYNFPSPPHPLHKLSPHDCVPFTEHVYAAGDAQLLETLPSPRVLSTHMHYCTLPESIRASTCPIVYICRDPKDVLVSIWHMTARIARSEELLPFTRAFELFCEGRVPNGPVWDHVLGYYTESLHRPQKILVLKYEEMMKNPSNGVTRLANFIGCPFSEEEVKKGLVEEIVQFCSFNKLKDLGVNKNGNVDNDLFFRKAVVGDWENHLTAEMATKLDEIIKEKFSLRDSDFTFGVSQG